MVEDLSTKALANGYVSYFFSVGVSSGLPLRCDKEPYQSSLMGGDVRRGGVANFSPSTTLDENRVWAGEMLPDFGFGDHSRLAREKGEAEEEG